MKLQNFMVLFVIIILPVILVTSYYMSLQIDTINMQTSYNEKLLESTKSAIAAYEINTVEWNADYYSTPDSKRRDIMASINSFTSSFANSLGIGGASKDNVLPYIPAIAYTLYDGYYIYSPAEIKETIIDENEITVTMNENLTTIISGQYEEEKNGKILYLYDAEKGGTSDGIYQGEGNCNGKEYTLDPQLAVTSYKHILKPFSTYSKTYSVGGKNIIINYTLDNYVKIYGETETEGEYVIKAGYLTDENTVNLYQVNSKSIKGIEYTGNKGTISIKPEILTENIGYYTNDKTQASLHRNVCYIYDSNNLKIYIDADGTAFTIDSSGKRVDIISEFSRFKKCTVPCYDDRTTSWTYIEIYQDLNSKKWYLRNGNTELIPDNLREISIEDLTRYLDLDGSTPIEETIKYDYSAVNYCVESKIFTNWANGLGIKIDGEDLFGNIEGNNNSIFNIEKRNVIKDAIQSSLRQAITSYSRNSENGYTIPKLSETDWDQVLTNVSIITFVQNIPIGMKYFNNYAIATSTQNKEYVDPNEIYLQASGDEYYHKAYCDKIEENNIVGYRNIDYILKSYEVDEIIETDEDGYNTTKTNEEYYYRHSDSNGIASQSCYYCLIQRELYVEEADGSNKKGNEVTAYCTALARERYAAKKIRLPAQKEAAYYIIVEPIDKDTEGVVMAPWIYRVDGEEGQTQRGPGEVPIEEDKTTYNIRSAAESIAYLGAYEDYHNYGEENNPNPAESGFTQLPGISPYESDANVTVNLLEYTPNGITVSIVDNSTNSFNAYFGNGQNSEIITAEQTMQIQSEVLNGYIYIKLPYKKNYKVAEINGVTANVTIDKKDQITIGTTVTGISGKIKLKYVNGNSIYSTQILELAEGVDTNIYFYIPQDTTWYTGNWHVEVCDIAGSTIVSTSEITEYYIKNADGLKGFAEGTNEGAITQGRTFTLVNDILGSDEVKMQPICALRSNPFNGVFNGNGKTIEKIRIQEPTLKDTYGFFGAVEENAQIKDLTIKLVMINSTNNNVGGLIGYNNCDNVENITIENSFILGGENVGGLIGYNNKSNNFKNVKIKNSTISARTNVGGVIGYNKGIIDGIINLNELNIKISALSNGGGIIGYNKGVDLNDITVNLIEEESTAGEIEYGDDEGSHAIEISMALEVESNGGGIVGYNKGSTISNCKINDIVIGGRNNTAGIAGEIKDSFIKGCENNSRIMQIDLRQGNASAGGIVRI